MNDVKGKTVVITGKFDDFTRAELSARLADMGALVGSSVTSKTDMLVCGEKPGSKLVKAQELGITILSESDLAQII